MGIGSQVVVVGTARTFPDNDNSAARRSDACQFLLGNNKWAVTLQRSITHLCLDVHTPRRFVEDRGNRNNSFITEAHIAVTKRDLLASPVCVA
jgi:hypothetical protein